MTEKELRKQIKKAERTRDQDRGALRRKVRIFYDFQRLRMQTAGRTYKRPGGVEIDLHEVDIAMLEYRAKELGRVEKTALKDVEDHLGSLPMWTQFLKPGPRYRGIGPTMAGVILSEFDIYKADTVSKMWAFAGLVPVPGFRCKECQMVVTKKNVQEFKHGKRPQCSKHLKTIGPRDVVETRIAQRPKRGEKLPYNAWLRTKLVGVLAGCMLKANSPYRKFYDNYKHRKESAGWGVNDAHRHNAASRYMIKMLLIDIHKDWRELEGLPVRPPYHEEYLGHTHAA
jgi:hypothetical protein